MEHISEQLLEDLDAALGEAIARVERGEAEQANVSLAFTVKPDDDMKPLVAYSQKNARTKKGSWSPARSLRLPLET